MPTKKTQELIDAVRAPKHCGEAELAAASEAFLDTIACAADQANEYLRLAQTAEALESDDQVRAGMEMYIQTARAMNDRIAVARNSVRDLLLSMRQMRRYEERLRPAAEAAGYQTDDPRGRTIQDG